MVLMLMLFGEEKEDKEEKEEEAREYDVLQARPAVRLCP